MAMDHSSPRPKVLCIDDTPEVCLLVRRLLSSHFQVLEAHDGLEGIEVAQEAQPDLVLVDLHMPHLTGYEVATRLKSLMPHVPIVALTADTTPNVRERALASGCDGYLAKPIDPDRFLDQVRTYLAGEREELEDESYRQAYLETLVARLEEKVRELTQTLEQNAELNEQNLRLLKQTRRYARLLEAGARVSRTITAILDLEALLQATVEAVGREFGFPLVGIFLLDETGEWAVLRAGRGGSGVLGGDGGERVGVDGTTMVGMAILQRRPITPADVEPEASLRGRPQAGMALPLIVGDRVIGALTVQRVGPAAFGNEDVAALQIVADQLAVSIGNARLLKDLERAHQELMRARTYEAIATATGEAIHWVGNKAAPIPGSVARIGEDLARYLHLAGALLEVVPPMLREHPFAQLLAEAVEELEALGFHREAVLEGLEGRSLARLRRMLSVSSIFEDLEIIEKSAQAILNIKEDLIGPARRRKPEPLSLPDLLRETVASMGIPDEIVQTRFADDLPLVQGDRIQLSRVFVNLIKNAMEAMEGREEKRLLLWARPAEEPGFVVVDVVDSGVGIPAEQLDKIWMAFYTTKGDRGGTGLGLPACAQIVNQMGGRITVQSEVGVGTTFSVFLPVATS
ncbi:MAG TPA: response regulator [Chloroflexi bacterium]|nr:response regulator [Chloroflexota bacterium]